MSAPPGFHYVWEVDDRWRLATAAERAERKCRQPRCQGKVVAALLRSRWNPWRRVQVPTWWLYCGDHLYGRRIVGDHLEFPRMRPIESPT